MRNSSIANFIAQRIDEMSKTQREIAREIGYGRPNMISMFKTGDARVPLEKIPALARALGVDAALLFRMALEQYWPKLNDTVTEIFGGVPTKNEWKIIHGIRLLSKESNPPLTPELEGLLKKSFEEGLVSSSA